MPGNTPPTIFVNGAAFTVKGKLAPKPIGYEHTMC